MSEFDPSTHPHRRFNPLTKEYILVSPHRTKRPWLGQTEPPQTASLPEYDPACYLCPGNSRSSGQKNPLYKDTFVFENDFAALLYPPLPHTAPPAHPLMIAEPLHGACDVVLFHPKHNLTMARMQLEEIGYVIEEWIRIYKARGSEPGIKYVQIFENKGAIMGCSNPHPHGQVWSSSEVPTIPAQELRSLKEYAFTKPAGGTAPRGFEGKPCLLCEYAHAEMEAPKDNGRVVVSNDHWVAVVPWWATWPFEILLLPYRRHIGSISDLSDAEKTTFAEILSRITKRYDNLFSCSFAYSMGIHQRPIPIKVGESDDADHDYDFAHLHVHFTPPLLRSATVKKFLVGYELMAEAQRDLTAEQAADRLRNCSEIHYLDAPRT
ncbi:Galactose-1-phosphate uridylyltransferase [Psilocybe cubensis]|uniref:Galactose-1-phosphate uridylyltransferase n=2 Tax=Psilocybe cubensis TaxID=181762 RepID=A0A8H8CMW4_PSICU|nr:Galactose-1-phosphate uridylyltransferase [Psilocybe cubensis]KAH9483852.1 Galactose-1-phosphate uridylyltransferase [Psilocybe cubensis]